MSVAANILVTGATGQLGGLVITELLKKVPAESITALARDVGSTAASTIAVKGVRVVSGDYTKPDTLDAAFKGIDRLLLISSNAVGQRGPQHQNVINAAKRTQVKRLAYTSILRASSSPIGLAEEHRQTETMLRQSGVPFVLLRNGWYSENYTDSIPDTLERGGGSGCAAEGRISSAARADYAAAAATVLTAEQASVGRIYELAGDGSYTLTDLAAEVSRQSGKPYQYTNMSQLDYEAALRNAGLPDWLAVMLADSSAGASKGALFDEGRELSTLIGRPTTPLAATIAKTLRG